MSQPRPHQAQPILGLIFWEPLFKPDSAPALSWTVFPGGRLHLHVPHQPETAGTRGPDRTNLSRDTTFSVTAGQPKQVASLSWACFLRS